MCTLLTNPGKLFLHTNVHHRDAPQAATKASGERDDVKKNITFTIHLACMTARFRGLPSRDFDLVNLMNAMLYIAIIFR